MTIRSAQSPPPRFAPAGLSRPRIWRDIGIGILAGLLLWTLLVYVGVPLLARHVDHDWDAKFLVLHDRWERAGIGPSGIIAGRDAPPRASDW